MTAGSTIDYEALAQEAMRGLVRTVLCRTAKSGLPGDHHFYISFDTEAPGVMLSKRLKEKYPREMTIVLQHRFWDLTVTDDQFEVKLTFDGIPERLVVPFAAIKVFFDPSVRYGLQFEEADLGADGHALSTSGLEPDTRPSRATPIRKPRGPRRPRPDRDAQRIDSATQDLSPGPLGGPAQTPANGTGKSARLEPAARSDKAAEEKPGGAPGAQIVSLDQFRKK